ncbi:MAG: PAQR family membrane homeostasis protein TrhA [Minwuia sp.]|uniref:PAQR family membrane homeostasis protein TrhA n=1 Tax=Minwuia sp. TaxID=2493630 RepID=UPI003A8411AB
MDNSASNAGSRPYSRGELIADAVIHSIGGLMALGACITLLILAVPDAGWLGITSIAIYLLGLSSMLGASALYNFAPEGRWKERFRRLDHSAIFVMIAGTYTPFSLVTIGGEWGLTLFVFVWTVALAGVALKVFLPGRFEKLSIAAYLLLGWVIVFALGPLLANVSIAGLVLLGAGGALYSLGVVFHVWERLKFQNAVWHGFVVAAASCHFAAVITDVALVA